MSKEVKADSVRNGEALLNSRQVAALLGVGLCYVTDHTRGKREPVLPGFKIGRNSVRYRPSDVAAWIDALARKSSAVPDAR